ncbi:MAG: DNA gyrase C-terminal beta-propeller domain-containing protein [Nitrospinales bacterium]
MEEYPLQGRGGYGVITIRCSEKIGSVIRVRQVNDGDEILLITSDGKIVRMNAGEISVIGRNTQGVRLVGLKEENRVVSFEKLIE